MREHPARRAAPRSPTRARARSRCRLRAGSGSGRTPRKNHAVFGSSKYSAFATNVTRRRSTSGRKIESRNERWFDGEDDRTAARDVARGPRPSRGSTRARTGVSTPFTIQYSKRAPRSTGVERTPRPHPLVVTEGRAQATRCADCAAGCVRRGRQRGVEAGRERVDLGEEPIVLDLHLAAALSSARCELRSYRRAVQDRARLVCIGTSFGIRQNSLNRRASECRRGVWRGDARRGHGPANS